MTNVFCHIAISLDGYAAGPNQSKDNPLGEGGMRLHEWTVKTASWGERHALEGGGRDSSSAVIEEVVENVGAYIMGRNMFTPGRGDWDLDWRGWWGEDPPYHPPASVLTSPPPVYALPPPPRESLQMQGGTTFHFVTDGIESALEQARRAAGDRDVSIAGGASAVRRSLSSGLLEELSLHTAPVFPGAGKRPLDGVGNPTLEPVKVVASPEVTHV